MPSIRTIALEVGIAGGILGFLNALIPGSNSWPMLWPAASGAVAFWMATTDDAPRRARRGMLAAFYTGIIVGSIAFIGSSLVVLALRRPVLSPVASTVGPHGPALVLSAAELGLLVVALLMVAVAVLGGAVMIPIRHFRGSPDRRTIRDSFEK